MVANPVVVSPVFDPLSACVALLAMAIEISVVLAVLRRTGRRPDRFERQLASVQLATWIPFVFAMGWVGRKFEHLVLGVTVLEILVVAVEVPLLREATRGWFGMPGLPSGSIDWRLALRASLLGNAASLAFSLGPPLLLMNLSG